MAATLLEIIERRDATSYRIACRICERLYTRLGSHLYLRANKSTTGCKVICRIGSRIGGRVILTRGSSVNTSSGTVELKIFSGASKTDEKFALPYSITGKLQLR